MGFEQLSEIPAPSGLFWAYMRYLPTQLISSHLDDKKMTVACENLLSAHHLPPYEHNRPHSCRNHRSSDRERSSPDVYDASTPSPSDRRAPDCRDSISSLSRHNAFPFGSRFQREHTVSRVRSSRQEGASVQHQNILHCTVAYCSGVHNTWTPKATATSNSAPQQHTQLSYKSEHLDSLDVGALQSGVGQQQSNTPLITHGAAPKANSPPGAAPQSITQRGARPLFFEDASPGEMPHPAAHAFWEPTSPPTPPRATKPPYPSRFPSPTLITAPPLTTLQRLRSPSRFREGVRHSLTVALQISRKEINVPRQGLTILRVGCATAGC
jgi:hypothetical protein